MFIRHARLAATGLFCVALLAPVAATHAQSKRSLFHQFRSQANDLARRQYLTTVMPQLSPPDRIFARQLLATVDSELGLYNEAVRDFPFDNREPLAKSLPRSDQWPGINVYDAIPAVNGAPVADAINAVDAIAKLAASRRIVLTNEAHHDAQTRELVLRLLPRLRALGYDYFAPEALTENGATLIRRGYPLKTSGTEYLREPLYGDLIREAIRLGYVIVPYDPIDPTADRDADQANNLYERVFAKDPNARLFVHAGYAHIDKAKGHLDSLEPMAMRLKQLTGLDPLSVDQTQFREVQPALHSDAYHWLTSAYHPRAPIVLKLQDTGRIWSADPTRHDVSVILPEPHGGGRPSWLSLDGQRQTWPISAALCMGTTPCVVEAHYANEPDDAIAADRDTFLSAHDSSKLYLRPGSYRLRAWGIDGKTLSERTIEVGKP